MIDEKKIILLVLDGWGLQNKKQGNTIKLAKTPVIDNLYKKWPNTKLSASGKAVGLPDKVMGNSEVGHLTLGAGRVVPSDLLRINQSIKNGSFFKNKILLKVFKKAKKNNEKVHLMGLLSDGGVHSHINHLFALLKLTKKVGLKEFTSMLFLTVEIHHQNLLKNISNNYKTNVKN